MKMKKILCSLFISMLCFMTTLTSVFAVDIYPTSNIDVACQRAINFYKGRTLETPDEIIAVESLGLEAEDECNINTLIDAFKENDYNEASLGDLSKTIIALSLTKQDPRSFNNSNLVELLENRIKEDGSIEGSTGTNIDVWVLYALFTVSSNKTTLVADRLSTQNNIEGQEGAFWYFWEGKCADVDTTGWAIEVLSIIDKAKYNTSITSAINYLKTQQKADASFGNYGASPNTQAAVLTGLLAYDREGLLNGSYDTENANAFKVLVDFQKEDGSVEMADWQTGEMTYNAMATYQLSLALGSYKNGSVFLKAQKDYQAIINPIATTIKENDQKVAVKTGDETVIITYMSLTIVSAGLFLVLKKEYEKAN